MCERERDTSVFGKAWATMTLGLYVSHWQRRGSSSLMRGGLGLCARDNKTLTLVEKLHSEWHQGDYKRRTS